MLVVHLAFVLQLRQPKHHGLSGGNVAEHSHEEVLDELEPGDRAAELAGAAARSAGVLVGAHLAPHREPRDPGAGHLLQHLRGVLEAVGPRWSRWNTAILHSLISAFLDDAQRNAVFDLLALLVTPSRRPALDLIRRFVARPNHVDIGESAVADPFLPAVQYPSVALASRGRGQSPEIAEPTLARSTRTTRSSPSASSAAATAASVLRRRRARWSLPRGRCVPRRSCDRRVDPRDFHADETVQQCRAPRRSRIPHRSRFRRYRVHVARRRLEEILPSPSDLQ